MTKEQQEFKEKEVQQALNELVENGELILITKNGEPAYIENTFQAGYNYAKNGG